MDIFNSKEYEWSDITAIVAGRPVTKIRAISYVKKQEKEAVKRAQARRKAVQNEYLNSQLAAAAYEKSSIILPDNPVIL